MLVTGRPAGRPVSVWWRRVLRPPSRTRMITLAAVPMRIFARVALLPHARRGVHHMGMAPPAPTYWTAEMVRQLPDDGNRYEVVRGELLVTPAPHFDHQLLVSRLAVAIGNYLAHEPVGGMLTSPADISWGRDVLVQPDVFVISHDEARSRDWSG